MRRALLAAGVLLTIAGSARADWEVHRSDTRPLLERAEQALRERPDDEVIARRLVQLAGARERAALRARFKVRAQQASSYSSLAAYAQLLWAMGETESAATAFADVLRAAPDSVPALTGRARALAATGKPQEALAAYDRALDRERHAGPRRRLIEAELALLARLPDDGEAFTREHVVALRRELLASDPDRDGSAERLADALERAGHPAEAAAVLEERVAPGRATEKLRLALRASQLRLGDGDPRDADRATETLLALVGQLAPSDAERRREVWSVAASAARRRGALPELAQQLSRLLARAPNATEWDVLAEVRNEMGDLDGALAASRAALAMAPRDVEIARRLITLLDRLGRDDEAAAAEAELWRRAPSDYRVAVDLIDRQMRTGHRLDAIATLDRATTRFARDRTALSDLAAAAARWGMDERALAAWQRLRRLDPTSEAAIVGLGEALFQRGKRDEARRTWSALRERERSPIAGHLRVAEVLLEHDLAADATVEVRRAQALDPKHVAVHRLLAQIFERQRRFDDAISEWTQILSLSPASPTTVGDGEDERASARHEARVRVLGLLARQGRGYLDAQVRKLRDELRGRPDDLELALFLAEAQQRSGDTAAAVATLRSALKTASAAKGRSPRSNVETEAVFALVHLLKRSGQLDEAIAELDEFARLAPSRAREAHLQIADVALARYDAPRALAHAAAAAADAADPQTLARVAELQARAGADALAIATYRQVVARDDSPASALALARLLDRTGDEAGAASVLAKLLRQSRDDEAIAEAGGLAVDLGELDGRLADLEREVAEALATGQDSAARRRILVTTLKRLLPSLYRDQGADEARERIARGALHPLLQLVTDTQETPDRATVELIGMLGHGDAAPALARLIDRPPPTAGNRAPAIASPVATVDVQRAAIVALGRLGDPRGRAALEKLAATGDITTRTAAIWALGRLGDSALPTLLRAVVDRQPPVAVAGCLGLGRQLRGGAIDPLVAAATDPRRPTEVRRAAIIGLGEVGARDATARRAATPTLLGLLDSGDPELAQGAALALGWSRDSAALPQLLARAVLPRRFTLADATAPVAALAIWAAGAAPPDDARLLAGSRADLDAVMSAAVPPRPRPDLTPLWHEHTRELSELLGDAMAQAEERRDVLSAIDGNGEGLALGALAPDTSVGPEVALAAREVLLPLVDRLAALLDDVDPGVQAAALRVLVKLGDERATPARIAAAASDGSPLLASAAAFAASRLARERPGVGTAVALAVAPLLSDDRWPCRLAAVEVLVALGPSGAASLDRARTDSHPVVRAAALAGRPTPQPRLDLPVAPSRMP